MCFWGKCCLFCFLCYHFAGFIDYHNVTNVCMILELDYIHGSEGKVTMT